MKSSPVKFRRCWQNTMTKARHKPVAKGMSWIKTNAKMGMDDSDQTVANLMTDGCNMGVKSLNMYLNQYKAADEVSKDITKRLINLEQKLTEDIREVSVNRAQSTLLGSGQGVCCRFAAYLRLCCLRTSSRNTSCIHRRRSYPSTLCCAGTTRWCWPYRSGRCTSGSSQARS